MADPGEIDAVLGVRTVEAAGDGAKDEFAASVLVEGDVGRPKQVGKIGVSKLNLHNPPFAEERARHHAACNFGSRTTL